MAFVAVCCVDEKLIVKVKGRYPGSDLAVVNIKSTSELIQSYNTFLKFFLIQSLKNFSPTLPCNVAIEMWSQGPSGNFRVRPLDSFHGNRHSGVIWKIVPSVVWATVEPVSGCEVREMREVWGGGTTWE